MTWYGWPPQFGDWNYYQGTTAIPQWWDSFPLPLQRTASNLTAADERTRSIKEKVQDLRQEIKNYEEALDELQGLLLELGEMLNRRRPISLPDTQDGMKT